MFKLLSLTLVLSFMMTLSAAEKAKKPSIVFIASAKEVYILTEADYNKLYTYKIKEPFIFTSKSAAPVKVKLKEPTDVTIVFNSYISKVKMSKIDVEAFIKYLTNKKMKNQKRPINDKGNGNNQP